MKEIAVILGNGPSLNDLPPHILRDYPTYGMNYAKHQPKFYVCVDQTILRTHADQIFNLAKNSEVAYLSVYDRFHPDFYTRRLYSLPNVQFIDKDKDAFREEYWMSGGTATYAALKMAYYAGYDEVWLWGVDHSPNWEHYDEHYPPPPADSPANDEEHRTMMLWHYMLARMVYEAAGRRILNFGNHGLLDKIFERGEL